MTTTSRIHLRSLEARSNRARVFETSEQWDSTVVNLVAEYDFGDELVGDSMAEITRRL